jgi:hypothetical protein
LLPTSVNVTPTCTLHTTPSTSTVTGKEKDELLKGLEEAEREAKRIEGTAKGCPAECTARERHRPATTHPFSGDAGFWIVSARMGAVKPKRAIVARVGEINATDIYGCFDVRCDVAGGDQHRDERRHDDVRAPASPGAAGIAAPIAVSGRRSAGRRKTGRNRGKIPEHGQGSD